MINYISNLPHDLRSGGFSAMNVAAWGALNGNFDANYVGPIDPPPGLAAKALSKALRLAGGRGDYHFFSSARLRSIATTVAEGCEAGAQLDFFHGFTPWIMTNPPRPYVAWSDCTFADYIEIYHDRGQFRTDSLDEIVRLEAQWLRSAARIAFTTEWAARRAISAYALDPKRVFIVGTFGAVDEPERDHYDGGHGFAFVSTNFVAKGGPTVLAGFRQIRAKYPGASLTVIGDRPKGVKTEFGITFAGYLRKENPDEHERFRGVLAKVRSIVHPTQRDIAPLLIIEAGYFGCPVIASNRCGIPELVRHGWSGLLLDDPTSDHEVASAMVWMLENDGDYLEMRRNAWASVREHNRREQFDARLVQFLTGASAPASLADR